MGGWRPLAPLAGLPPPFLYRAAHIVGLQVDAAVQGVGGARLLIAPAAGHAVTGGVAGAVQLGSVRGARGGAVWGVWEVGRAHQLGTLLPPVYMHFTSLKPA